MSSKSRSIRLRSVLVAPTTGERWLTPWGETVRAKRADDHTSGAFTSSELVAPPGWSRSPYVHDSVDECFYFAQGEFEVRLGDREGVLRPDTGSVLYVPAGVMRSLRNGGTGTGRLLVLQTPGSSPGPGSRVAMKRVGPASRAPMVPSSTAAR